MSTQHAAVIGAGFQGLQALRSLKETGVNVMCFDVADGWGRQCKQNYPFLDLQAAREMYDLSDKTSISRGQVDQQCEKYVEQCGLRQHIHFSTEVLMVSTGQSRAWKLRYRKLKTAEEETEQEFDFVVLATGSYSPRQLDTPKVPGMEISRGKTLHNGASQKLVSEQFPRPCVKRSSHARRREQRGSRSLSV